MTVEELLQMPNLPNWARWVAQDEDGTVCVFEKMPVIAHDNDGGFWAYDENHNDSYRIKKIHRKKANPEWKATLRMIP